MPRTANHKTEDESATRVTRSLRNRIVTSNMETPKKATRNKKLEDGKDLSTSPESLDQDNKSRASSTASFSKEDQSNGPEKLEGAESQNTRKRRSKSAVDESLIKTPGRRITRTMSASEGGNVLLTPKRTSRRLNSSSEVDVKSNKSVTMSKFSPEPLLEDKDAEEKETLHRVRTRASTTSPHTTETKRTPIVKLTKQNNVNSPTKEPESTNENNDSANCEVEVVENKNDSDRKLEDITEIEDPDLSPAKEKTVSFHHSLQAGDKSPTRFPKTPIASKSKISIEINDSSQDKSEISIEPPVKSETSSVIEGDDKSILADTSIIAPPPVETRQSETPKLPVKKCVSQMSSSTPIDSRKADNEKTARNLMDSNTSDKSSQNETNPDQIQIVEDDEEDVVETNKGEATKDASESNQCVEKENENSQQDVEMISVDSQNNEKSNSFHGETDKAQKSEKIYSKSWSQSVRGTTSEGQDFIDGLGVLDRKEPEVIKSKDDSNKSPHYSDEEDVEYYEEEEEEEADAVKKSEFLDDEAMENDEDSLNSSEREYLKQNEIPVEGESIGSEDTNSMKEDHEEDEENDSFIVSDDCDGDKLSVDTNENVFSSENSIESNSENKNTSKVGSALRIEDYDDDESNEPKQKETKSSQKPSTKPGGSLKRKRAFSSSEDEVEVEETNLAKDVNDSSDNLLDNNGEHTPENQSESEEKPADSSNDSNSNNKEEVVLDETLHLNNLFDEIGPSSSQGSCRSMEKLFVEEDSSNEDNDGEEAEFSKSSSSEIGESTAITKAKSSKKEIFHNLSKLESKDASDDSSSSSDDEGIVSKQKRRDTKEAKTAQHISSEEDNVEDIDEIVEVKKKKVKKPTNVAAPSDEPKISSILQRCQEILQRREEEKKKIRLEHKKKKVKKTKKKDKHSHTEEDNIQDLVPTLVKSKRKKENSTLKKETAKKIEHVKLMQEVREIVPKVKPRQVEEVTEKRKRMFSDSSVMEQVLPKKKKKLNVLNLVSSSGKFKEEKLNTVGVVKNVNGFVESDLRAPESIGHKMKTLLNTEEFDYVSKKKKKIKRKREIPEPLTLLPKPKWSSSGDFTVAKLPKTGGEIYVKPSNSGSVTEFMVEPLNVKKRKLETDVEHRAMEFKKSALYNSDRIKRESSKLLLQRKKRQEIYKSF